jgi:hypothetical protein
MVSNFTARTAMGFTDGFSFQLRRLSGEVSSTMEGMGILVGGCFVVGIRQVLILLNSSNRPEGLLLDWLWEPTSIPEFANKERPPRFKPIRGGG